MIAASRRVPNFAGVALVDILANGVAVLIIVIVLSIASRFEQEKQYNERIQELSAVMTREFSTSLVLNRLAAGPPAVLHDYENSPMDQIWDPRVMPVFEIHRDAVRDPYSGRVWTRAELLQEPNDLDRFLSTFDVFQRQSVRGDFYDIGSFYLLMSILKDHDITISHWHFIGATGFGLDQAVSSCPAGMSAKDCNTSGSNQATSTMTDVYDSLASADDNDGPDGGSAWPPADARLQDGEAESGVFDDELPQGAQLGPGGGTELELGSFPDARSTRGRMRGQGIPGNADTAASSLTIRLADPTLTPMLPNAVSMSDIQSDPEVFLLALMTFLDEVQKLYDDDRPPTEFLHQFIPILQGLLEQPPTVSDEYLEAIADLTLAIELIQSQRLGESPAEPLLTLPLPPSRHPEALLRVAVNRVLIEAEIQSNNQPQLTNVPGQAKVRFNLQAYPDIWRGLQIALERDAAILMPPNQIEPTVPKWRAIGYISPQLDDFVVGFVYGTVDDAGQLEIVANTNRGMVDTVPIAPNWLRDSFGIRTWMTLLYAVAGIVLVGLLFFWRPGTRMHR
ncbi:MAG: hypothetical protein F4W90_12610 [Gammaproteobacteria bacterium]|nr:hypothetical protein [Gammaproteobacteria bacterium]